MERTLLKSKIHRATVTDADLHYEGSVTIDRDLMDAAKLVEYEKVAILDINNGARFETYVIEGPRGKGDICLNGAAARMVQKGDLVIIVSYCSLNEEEVAAHTPTLVFVDEKNHIKHGTTLHAVV
jgi:aspartate 1-decarboxylase